MKGRKTVGVYTILFTIVLAGGVAPSVVGQDTAGSGLDSKYREMVSKSETFESYKVISADKLNAFWKETTDSLKSYQNEIEQTEARAKTAEQQAILAMDSLSVVYGKLEASETVNQSIDFLGISVSKRGYNIVVWTIMSALLVSLGVLYMAFKQKDDITMKAKNDLIKVAEELDDLRQKSHEKQVKLKRELQTALNQMEEARRKVSFGK